MVSELVVDNEESQSEVGGRRSDPVRYKAHMLIYSIRAMIAPPLFALRNHGTLSKPRVVSVEPQRGLRSSLCLRNDTSNVVLRE